MNLNWMYRKRKIKTIAEDLFIKRLRCSVIGEGMLHQGNIYLIDYAIRNLPDSGIILEIGSYAGLSTNLILYLLRKYNMKITMMTCDAWIYEGYNDHWGEASEFMDGNESITRHDYMKYIKQAFINSTRLLDGQNLPFSFEMTSDDFFLRYSRKETATDVFGRSVPLGGKIAFS